MKPISPGLAKGQSGGILIGVVAALLGVFALLAAIAEVGAARVSQSKLQGAVDSAAREGLRARDLLPSPAESERRERARAIVRLTFDADLDLGTSDPLLQLGAGGIVPLADLGGIGGAGGFDPGALSVYRPDPALNLGNEPHGDMVAGTYIPTWPPVENGLYERDDFVSATEAASPQAGAFLVRSRRTNDPLGLDTVPGVSTSAAPLPLLFALGTTLQPIDGTGDVYDPRRDGLTIRATAIACASPALAVSTGPAGQGLLECGLASPDGSSLAIALDTDHWSTLTPGDVMSLEVDAGQVIETTTATVVGAVVSITPLTEVGDELFVVTANTDLDPSDAGASSLPRAILVARAEGPGALRVVAFGAVEPQSVTVDGATGSLTISALRSPGTMAAERASVHAPSAWLALEFAGPAEVPGLRAAFDAVPDRLLAPVLVR